MILYLNGREKHSRTKDIIYEVTSDDCWECTNHHTNNGHTMVTVHGFKDRLYRHVYREFKGEIPRHLMVRHLCNNKKCINPEHLALGTHQDNMNDVRKFGGQKGPNNPMYKHQYSEEERKMRSEIMKNTETVLWKKCYVVFPDGRLQTYPSHSKCYEDLQISKQFFKKLMELEKPYKAPRSNVRHLDGIMIFAGEIGNEKADQLANKAMNEVGGKF